MKPINETRYNYLNYNSATAYNSDYNSKVGTLLADYFSPDELKSFNEYVFVGNYRVDLASAFSFLEGNETMITKPAKGAKLEEFSMLSAYERMLISHFFHGNFLTYIILGAMGSGKTTTLNYVLDSIKKIPKYKDTFQVKLDFAKGYGNVGNNFDQLLEQFHIDFYKKIKAELIEGIHSHNLSTEFIASVKDQHQLFSDFYDLSFYVIEKNQKEWFDLTEKEKVFEIFKYIENETPRGTIARLNLVMYFVLFIKQFLASKEIPVLFVYDNIDKLPPAVQRAIFINVLALNSIANVKMIFTLRRSTKAKISKVLSRDETPLFENRAQYPYAYIYHHGPSVSKIYKTKLEKLIEDIDKIELFDQLDSSTKECITLRAKEILDKLNTKNHPFKHAYNGISGQSKRLALTLAHRPFCNNIINFDSEANNLQSLVRTVYSGDGENMRISLSDLYVCNIYSNSKNHFTLLNYFILYILENYSSDLKLSYLRNVKNLYDFLSNYTEYTTIEIISSLNFLLSDKRALIGGEYFPKYNSLDDILRLQDNLRITELGDRYFNNLVLHGGIYNQVCLLSLKWKNLSDYTYKNDSIAERFADLRFCVNCVREEEDKRFAIVKRNTKLIFKKEIKLEHISDNMVKLFSNSLLNILPSLDLRDTLIEEVKAWRDLVIYMNYLHKTLNKEEKEFEKYFRKHKIS